MDNFGSLLKRKRTNKELTQKGLSQLLRRQNVFINHSLISRWEMGKRTPGPEYRNDLIALGKVLKMREDEMSQLLVSAGLAPPRLGELDLDKILRKLGPTRWHKTRFLASKMEWSEEQISEKLGIPFWEVREDLARVRGEESGSRAAKHPEVSKALEEHQRDLCRVIETWDSE
ncbi:unnamed protein product, partial [marine sediment metagenome]